MSNLKTDENGFPMMTALLNTDGSTVISLKSDPTIHSLSISNGSTGSDNGNNNGIIYIGDRIPVLAALSSANDVTIVNLYTDSTGHLLVNSN